MTPLQAFEDTLDRARYFVRLRNGLVNVRKRGIRSDWKAKFCSLMHWPASSGISRIDGNDAIIVLRDEAELQAQDFSSNATDELLRSALVYGLSAVDRYMHERVVRGIIPALRSTTLNQQQKDFSVPATEVMKMAQRAARASHAGEVVRPANDLRNAIQELLHKRPIQSWREIDWAFKLLGETKLETKLKAALSVQDLGPVKKTLGDINHRRNSIVHEGDLLKFKRAGRARLKLKEISPGDVTSQLDFLEVLVQALDTI